MKKTLMAFLVAAFVGWASFAEDEVATRINLTSQPSGVSVTVDGQDRGVTPLMLFDLTPGRHHVKYRMAGYVDRDRFINIVEGPNPEKNEVMQEEKGLLLLKTEPADCDIRIDGVSVGRTPRLITHLSTKDAYTVKLVKPGYQEQTITVKFDGRTPLVREETLVLDSGVIHITSDPSGANVSVNGIPKGQTPLLVSGVPKGRAVVKFALDGFKEEVRELEMRAGDRQELPIVLSALPGTLHLISIPSGARFYVNDEIRGAGPLSIPGLKPGDYLIRAEKEGFGTMTRTVTIANGESAREEFRMSNVMGRLEVRTDPVGASLILDGHTVGVTKAAAEDAVFSDVFAIENVLEGEHTLVIHKDGYEDVVRHPKVQNSQTLQARIRLKRIFVPDVEIVTARGSYRGVLVSNTPESVEVEVTLGITRSFSRSEIRKINFLNEKSK